MPQETAENLHDLLVMRLQALYSMEQDLTQAIPKMVEAATDEDLKIAFQSHLKETENHTARIAQALDLLDAQAEPMESDAVKGLVADTEWCIDNITNTQVLDASLIAAAQYVEHYEMAGYGSAATWAEQLGEMEVKNLLGKTLEEEKAADEKLSGLAMVKINQQAQDEEVEEGRKGILGRLSEMAT